MKLFPKSKGGLDIISYARARYQLRNYNHSRAHIGVQILFYPRAETVGSLLETKGNSPSRFSPPSVRRLPATPHECANYNSICPYGFRYHQSRRVLHSPPRALPIVAAFCFVITSILPPIFLFPRRHIQFLSDIISIDIFCWI